MITRKCSKYNKELNSFAVCGCEQNDGRFFAFRGVCKEYLHKN